MSAAGRKRLVNPLKLWKSPPQYGGMPLSLLTRPLWKTLRARLLCRLKSLYQFVVSVEPYPYAKN